MDDHLRADVQPALQALLEDTHIHQPLLSGRAAGAAFYPLTLITELLRGMRDTFDAERPDHSPEDHELRRGMARAALLHDEPVGVLAALQQEDLARANTKRTTTFHMADGTSKTIALNAHFKDV